MAEKSAAHQAGRSHARFLSHRPATRRACGIPGDTEMNGTTTTTMLRAALLDPAKRAHYRLAWLSTVDHKRIAVLYLLTALFFFVIGGVEALFTRLQLAV